MTNAPMYLAERLPVFQNRIFRTAEEARGCAVGDVTLIQNPGTGLISNYSFQPELMTYDSDYHNEQTVSPVFQAHLRDVSAIIHRHFSGLSLIEVGCGKGHFLEALQADGFSVTGMDPTYEGTNPAIVRQYFNAEAGHTGEGIVLRHVLEHVQDPVGFLGQIRDTNGGKGRIYIEVPCFDWICDRRVWFDIFYEHVNYFRLSDFSRMFGSIHESGHTFGGQYLYAVAELESLRIPHCDESCEFRFPPSFLGSVERYAAKVRSGRAGPVALWGAASKGVVFALFMSRARAALDMAIDINPAKHGMFLPGTGLPVCSPEAAMSALAPGSEIFVMNGNYLKEIQAMTRNQYSCIPVDHE